MKEKKFTDSNPVQRSSEKESKWIEVIEPDPIADPSLLSFQTPISTNSGSLLENTKCENKK